MAGIPVFNLAGTGVGSVTAATVAWPSHATNDVALLLIESANEDVTLSTAAGFVQITDSPQGTGVAASTTAVRIEAYWCRATSATQASVVIADPGNHVAAQIITFTNIATKGNPWNVTSGGVQDTPSTNCQVAGATTTMADCLVVVVVANDLDIANAPASTWTNGNLASPTFAQVASFQTQAGNGGGFGVAAGGLAVAGTSTVTLASATKQAFMVIALRPDFEGPTAVALPKPTLSGTGLRGLIGSAAMAVTLALAGTGSVSAPPVTGSGTVAVAPGLAGSGQQRHTGSGGVTLSTPSLAGAGQQRITGTGSVAVAPTLSGAGLRGNIGSGTAAVAPTLSGSGQQRHTGTGSAAVAPVISGTGLRGNIGSGSAAVSPSLSATGQQRHTGSGSAAVAPTLSGTGKQQHTGTGSAAVPIPTIAGTGTTAAGGAITGSGTVAVAPSLSGVGLRGNTGTGAVAVAIPTIAGSGQQRHTASGGVVVSTPTISATGKRGNVGTGSIAVAPVLSGTGLRGNTGTGAVVVAPSLSATGTFTSSRRGGKYQPEHANALVEIAAQNEFTETHAGVLRDLADAGV